MHYTLTVALDSDQYNDLMYALDLAKDDARSNEQRLRIEKLISAVCNGMKTHF